MKKLLLALVALACAFAISSCCDQSYCPGKLRCGENGRGKSEGTGYAGRNYQQDGKQYQQTEDVPYRFDRRDQPMPGSRRQGSSEECPDTPPRTHRRW